MTDNSARGGDAAVEPPDTRLDTLARLVRFAVVGATAAGVYAIVALVLIDSVGLAAMAASVIAYLVAIPVSFAGQKLWTFRSQGPVEREVPRFVGVQLANLAASAALLDVVVDRLHFDRLVGIAAVCVAVPLATYIALRYLVFIRPGA